MNDEYFSAKTAELIPMFSQLNLKNVDEIKPYIHAVLRQIARDQHNRDVEAIEYLDIWYGDSGHTIRARYLKALNDVEVK
jgi:hypothetical protein